MYARCLDILTVSDGCLAYHERHPVLHAPWIGESPACVAKCDVADVTFFLTIAFTRA